MNYYAVLKSIFYIAVAALLLDAIWLYIRRDYHNTLFSSIQKAPLDIRILPAIGVYLLLPAIIYFSAVKSASSLQEAALKGAATGAMLYGFYDLTNYSTLKGWTLTMTLTDTLWGSFLCAATAAFGHYMIH